jgi:hypothetical protein
MPPRDVQARVTIELHDVAPATWPDCERVLRMLDEAGATRLTLLVVPHFHRARPLAADARVVAALERRLARGDELVLHGCYHVDDQAPPRGIRDYVARRVLTRGEGEFAALGEAEAASRIERGVALFTRLGWPLYGFVPPAWLLGEGARAALARSRAFEYVAVRSGVYRLPGWRHVPTATVAYSPDRAWRRAMSRVMIRREMRRARSLPLLRLAIHPQDARVPEVMRHWRAIVDEALALRPAIAKHEWIAATT